MRISLRNLDNLAHDENKEGDVDEDNEKNWGEKTNQEWQWCHPASEIGFTKDVIKIDAVCSVV